MNIQELVRINILFCILDVDNKDMVKMIDFKRHANWSLVILCLEELHSLYFHSFFLFLQMIQSNI